MTFKQPTLTRSRIRNIMARITWQPGNKTENSCKAARPLPTVAATKIAANLAGCGSTTSAGLPLNLGEILLMPSNCVKKCSIQHYQPYIQRMRTSSWGKILIYTIAQFGYTHATITNTIERVGWTKRRSTILVGILDNRATNPVWFVSKLKRVGIWRKQSQSMDKPNVFHSGRTLNGAPKSDVWFYCQLFVRKN